MYPVPIIECLNNNLPELCQHVLKRHALKENLKLYLPDPLSKHCQIGGFVKGCLMIMTEACWATELRYHVPALRDKLRTQAGLYQLISIKIIISMNEQSKPLTQHTNKISLSRSARSIIQTAGDQCTYLPLKNALYQLAKTKVTVHEPHHPERTVTNEVT